MAEKPSPDIERLRLWTEATLLMAANPSLPPASIAQLLGISESYVQVIMRSALGKTLLRIYRDDPPPNLDLLKYDQDWAVRAALNLK